MSAVGFIGNGSIVDAVTGIDEASLKQCSMCGEWKPRTEFHINQHVKDGRDHRCKSCKSIYQLTLKYREKSEIQEKQCSICRETKPVKEFSGNQRHKDGLDHRCKSCKTEYDSRYWKTARGKLINKRKDYKRRALEKQNESIPYTQAELKERYRLINGILFNHSCPYCGDELPFREATIDHFIPVSLGGSDSTKNLFLVCFSCNSSKQDKHPMIWCRKRKLKYRYFVLLTTPEWRQHLFELAKILNPMREKIG